MNNCVRWLAICALGASATMAQDGNGRHTFGVRGEIVSVQSWGGALTVELMPEGMGMPERALVNADGTFEFRAVTAGLHQLRVVGPSGTVIYQEIVTTGGPSQFLTIRLPEVSRRGTADRSKDNIISVQQLSHKVPGDARKAFSKGEKAAGKSQHAQAADFFKQAIAIDPEFVDAYNQLGAAEVSMGDLPHAAEHFQKAIDIVPEHPLALANLAIVLAKLNRYKEAGPVARRALKAAPASCPMHYIVAVSVLLANGDREDVLDHLGRSSAQIPKAHLLAAEVLTELRRNDDAVRHLRQYLDASPAGAADRSKVEEQIARLQETAARKE